MRVRGGLRAALIMLCRAGGNTPRWRLCSFPRRPPLRGVASIQGRRQPTRSKFEIHSPPISRCGPGGRMTQAEIDDGLEGADRNRPVPGRPDCTRLAAGRRGGRGRKSRHRSHRLRRQQEGQGRSAASRLEIQSKSRGNAVASRWFSRMPGAALPKSTGARAAYDVHVNPEIASNSRTIAST